MPKNKCIWIDLDNSPHVPFFLPIISDLKRNRFEILLTVRNAFQTAELARYHKLKFTTVGRHYGKILVFKIFGVIWRSIQLLPLIHKKRPSIAISHGSRSQIFLCSILRIPSIFLYDYEHAKALNFIKSDYSMAPEITKKNNTSKKSKRATIYYPGLKEYVYAPHFKPDGRIINELGIIQGSVVVTIRPPATEAHYHDNRSESLYRSAVDYILMKDNIQIIIIPRSNDKVTRLIRKKYSDEIKSKRLIIPEVPVDGLNLIWHSDLVISGGGTMNREAASLSVPVYSIFTGKKGAIDRYLEETGRLRFIVGEEDMEKTIKIKKRKMDTRRNRNMNRSKEFIMGKIYEIIETIN
jgi:predicted glycosyltransferase